MKRVLTVTLALLVLTTTWAQAAGNFSFSINVGGPPVVIEQPPAFLYPPELGFGVAVGVPYDMYYLGGVYYIYRGGGWYRTSRYGGDWIQVRHRELPYELRRYKVARIHEYRDREYRVYDRDRDHYRGRTFRPDHGRGEEYRGQGRRPDIGERRGHEGRGEGRPERGGDHRDERGR
ncbi:hypothetical protein GMST_24040 [Geomonas silvestris]|uniref:Lipoprotein n=1 Tax=Geomonas silvestris TaxID=2740184 RepID=A0A6V8MK52_9BACT|nr:hypothetical protein [Geomonas silvestris]GFO60079.1 hypothetical protein GMST_24040 [Geomonas silvestris]